MSGEIRPPMTLSVDQIVNWEYQINPRNDMISRARKAIEGLKRTKKGMLGGKEVSKPPVDTYVQENYLIEIGANPYVSAKESIYLNDKPANEKAKESKDSQPENKKSLATQNDVSPY